METKLSIRWELNIAVLGTDPHTMGAKVPIRWGRNYYKLRIKTAVRRTD